MSDHDDTVFLLQHWHAGEGLLRTLLRNDLKNQLRSPRWRSVRPEIESSRESVLDLEPARSTEMPERVLEKAKERAWARLALELESVDAARMRRRRSVQPRLANILRLLKSGGVDELLAQSG